MTEINPAPSESARELAETICKKLIGGLQHKARKELGDFAGKQFYDYYVNFVAAAIAEHDAEKDALLEEAGEAFGDIIEFFIKPNENHNDRFERIGDMFLRETGKLRPGKDVSESDHGSGATQEEFDKWCDTKIARARALLSKLDGQGEK